MNMKTVHVHRRKFGNYRKARTHTQIKFQHDPTPGEMGVFYYIFYILEGISCVCVQNEI